MNAHGWKTYLAGASAILAGVVAGINGDWHTGFTGIIGGLALVGVRGAFAKVIQAISDNAK